MSILVVGSVALDTIRTPLGKCKDVLGGSATYFSISASFFSPVNLVAVVGNDFPVRYITLLEKRKIDLKGLVVKKGGTFRWEGEYSCDLRDPKTLSTCLNVFADFKPRIPEEYKESKYVFLANIAPEIQEEVLKQVIKPKLVVCDTMNYWIETKLNNLLKLLKKVDIFLLNESEAKALTGENALIKVAKAIARLGPKRVIIKRGENGALLFSDGDIFSIPAFLLESTFDPTGAGDTFAGGVVGYLANCPKFTQTNLRKAVVYGSIMATFAVEDFSVRRLVSVTKKDINNRLNRFKKLMRF